MIVLAEQDDNDSTASWITLMIFDDKITFLYPHIMITISGFMAQ